MIRIHLALWGLFTLLMVSVPSWSAPQPEGSRVVVTPISIEARTMEGAAPRADAEVFSKRLSDAATQAATQEAKTRLLKDRMATTAERAPGAPASAVLSGTVLSGSIILPLSLPPGVIGLRAHDRAGSFASAHFTWHAANGTAIAEETITVGWDDVRWLRGTHHTRRNRKVDEVLMDVVRKAATLAVKRLSQRRTGR